MNDIRKMNDTSPPNEPLLEELAELRQKIAELEAQFDGRSAEADQYFQELESTNQVLRVEITQHQHAALALKQSEAKYRELVQNANSIILRMDANGIVTFFNEFAHAFFGYAASEIMGKNVVGTIVPETDASGRDLTEMIQIIGQDPDAFRNNENENMKKNGERVWVAWTNKAIRNEQGHIVEILCVGNDQTAQKKASRELETYRAQLEELVGERTVELEAANQQLLREIEDRKQIEDALRDSEGRYRNMLESMPYGIFIGDFSRERFLFLNKKLCDMLGCTASQAMDMPLLEPVHPAERNMARKRIDAVVRSGRYDSGSKVYTGQRRDGTTVRFEVTVSPVTYQGKQAIQGVLRDVTEQELLEKRLQQSQKMEAVGTLASGIAHDFNNILQVISGYIQLMLTKTDQDLTGKKYLGEIDDAVERAAELVRRLLTFGRRVESQLRPVNLNDEVRHSVKILERTIPKMIGIETRLARDLALVAGDPYQLEQVMMNLGANARDGMPEGGRLVIQTDNILLDKEFCSALPDVEPGRYVCLRVSDTGCGMDEETVKHAFEPFFTTKDVGQGTGLGLSTVYGVVKGHGGRITCDSRIGHGTTFTVYLPALEAGNATFTGSSANALEVGGGDETILLVDDEPAILETVRDILEGYGYTVLNAESGEQAIDLYRARGPAIDLVILDLGMPGMGGRGCLKELMALDPGVQVMIASGYSANGQVKGMLDRGAATFIGKPYRVTDLLTRVRHVLDGNTGSNGPEPIEKRGPKT